MNRVYYYPAIFTAEDIGFSVSFPDLPGCFTEGDTLEEAYKMAASAIGLYTQTENGNFEFQTASSPKDIELDKNEFLVLIKFDLVEYLKNNCEKSVKKTLTIPSWLNNLAEQNNVKHTSA